MRYLTRTEILRNKYKYPSDFVNLIYTNHFKERLSERGLGLECIPKIVRVTENNIHSGKTNDEVHLCSVVVRLEYSTSKYLFIAFNPFDGGCKTLWFRKRKRDHGNTTRNRRSFEQTI